MRFRLIFEEAEIRIQARSISEAITRGRRLGQAGAGWLISVQVPS